MTPAEIRHEVEEMQQAAIRAPGPVGSVLTRAALGLAVVAVQAERAPTPEFATRTLLGGIMSAVSTLGDFQRRIPRLAGAVESVVWRLNALAE